MTNTGAFLLPAEVSWHNWGQLFTDDQLWRPVVIRVCRDAGMSPISTITMGYPGTCAVWVVDGTAVVKLFPPFLKQDFEREREAYQLLDERLPELPRLAGAGIFHDALEWPYLLLEYRAGAAIREIHQKLTPSDKDGLAAQLGRMIRIAHQTPLDDAYHLTGERRTWERFLQGRRLKCAGELRQHTAFSEELVHQVAEFLSQCDLSPGDSQPVLLNGDLTDDHLLLLPEAGGWRISALIDWADALVGMPEYEWVALWFGLCRRDAAMFGAILQAYDPDLKLDEGYRLRLLAFTLLHRFGAQIMNDIWETDGRPAISSIEELADWMWPVL